MPVAERLRPFGSTVFADMAALAARHDAVNLSQGFPDFDGPAPVLEAMGRAAAGNRNQYAPTHGVPELRRAIADWAALFGGPAIDPDAGVTVTCGCTEAIAATVLGMIDPGDGVVLFEPFYDSYLATLHMAGAKVMPVPLAPDDEGVFVFDEGRLREAFATGPRAILLNTPHNPTGKVFTRTELALIADLCMEHDVVAITDEVYDHLVLDGPDEHVRLAGLPGMAERTITFGSIGKLFNVTGWKVGWAVAPPELTRAVRAGHQFLSYAANTPAQVASALALREHLGFTAELRTHFRAMRDLLSEALLDAGLRVFGAPSGYFVMVDHTAVSERLGVDGDVEFCRYLVEEIGVAAIPPSSFYVDRRLGRPFARFAFCKTRATIEAGAERLGRL
ncbi:MAG: aminotransferase class I/II-fold pyridoxal phosphate-dependent enzyme [Planctomycetota bacterium]